MKTPLVFCLTIILAGCFDSIAQSPTNTAMNSDSAFVVLPQSDFEINKWKEQDFLVFDPGFKEKMADRMARTHVLGKQVIEREMSGHRTYFSHQILSEIIWLVSSTADFKRIDKRLDDLQVSLNDPQGELKGKEQDSTDGSWGKGYSEWFFKVIASFPHLKKESTVKPGFIDRVNSPEKLSNYLTSVSVSDIARTGIDNEREFNESVSFLMRMINRHRPKTYAYDTLLKSTLTDLLMNKFRNPVTGYWGESYIHEGKLYYADDLSITFHVVSFLKGNVPDMDKVVATTLAAKDLEFPVGNLYKGQRYDHLNMDVAELFRLGWPHASDAQKKATSAELQELLDWCLTESLNADGSFKFWGGDNSKEETAYYGTSFLARIGYFDKSKRFWTDKDFPEARSVRRKIIAYIKKNMKSGGSGGDYYESALEELK